MFDAKKLCGWLFILLLLGTSAYAQEFTGTVDGRVNDSTGAVVPGVAVTLSGPAIQGMRTAVTGETGAYRFTLIPTGTYTLKFELPGFKTLIREGIIVSVLKTTSINAALEVSTVAETVTVTGESPVVDVENATVGVNFTQSMLRDIPNSRDIWIVLSQAPGINTTRYDVGGSTMGSQTGFRSYGTSGQNTFNMDGINTTDGAGSAGWYMDYGSFQEMQVSAAGNNAEVQTPGALVNTVIKSGGNTVHGMAYLDWDGHQTQGQNVTPAMASLCPTTAAAAQTFTGPCGLYSRDISGNLHPGGDQFDRYNDFNAQFGGPIKKDKLWYFISWRDQYSGLITQSGIADSAETQYGLPVSAASVIGGGQYTTRLRIPTVKFNYQMTPKNAFNFVWQHSRKHAPNRSGQGATAYQYILESEGDQRDPSDGRKWELTSIVTPRLTLDFKAADSQYIFPQYSHTDKTRVTDTTTGFVRGGSNGSVEWRKHWDWGGNASYFKEGLLGANHNFKFGYDVLYESTRDFTLGNPGGLTLTVATNAQGTQIPSQFQIQDYPYTSENAVFQNAAFVQDKIEIRKRLTISVGVRWDRYRPYYPDQGNPGNGPWGDPAALGIGAYAPLPQKTVSKTYVATFSNVVPRISLAYDLFGNGRTAIKASAGKFSWNPSFSLASSANPNRGATYTYKWDGTLPITPAYIIANGKSLYSTNSVPASTVIDPNLSNSWSDQYTVGIEHQIIQDLGIRANYIRIMEQNPYTSVNTAFTVNDYSPLGVTDPGRDAILGTADDQNITVYNLNKPFVNNTLITNFKGLGSNYSTFETGMTKRMSNKWMAQVSWDVTKRNLRQDISLDPNVLNWGANANVHYWDWSFKTVFQYQLPYGVNYTTTFDSQKGETYTRAFTLSGLSQGNVTINAEHNGQNFYPTVKLWNMRFEKQFKFKEAQNISALFDLFNVSNQATATGFVTSVGTVTYKTTGNTLSSNFGYQRQLTSILNPRIFRLGVRYNF